MALTQVDGGLLSPTNAQYTGFKNRIINGAMQIDQRNAGASLTVGTGTVYNLDRWQTYRDPSGSGAFTAQQVSDAPVGFVYSDKITVTASQSSVSTLQYTFAQFIEGFNVADLNWGSVNAKTITLSFWVKSSLTGTFAGGLSNSDGSRSYPFNYTISSANTWTQISITIAGDTTGTWLTTNGIGIRVIWDLGTGSNYQGTVNSWQSAYVYSTSGATRVIGTNGATFYITGVQLEKGSTATSFDYRPYGTELALCQRYYQRYQATAAYTPSVLPGFQRTSTGFVGAFMFPVIMRAAPTGNSTNSTNAWYISTGTDANGNSIGFSESSPFSIDFAITTTAGVIGQGGKIYPVAAGTYFDLSAEL